jgi:hypothetical protein
MRKIPNELRSQKRNASRSLPVKVLYNRPQNQKGHCGSYHHEIIICWTHAWLFHVLYCLFIYSLYVCTLCGLSHVHVYTYSYILESLVSLIEIACHFLRYIGCFAWTLCDIYIYILYHYNLWKFSGLIFTCNQETFLMSVWFDFWGTKAIMWLKPIRWISSVKP